MPADTPTPHRNWRLTRWLVVLIVAAVGWSGWRAYAVRSALAQAKAMLAREVYVGQATSPELWPYRYTLVREGGKWSGEVEMIWDGGSMAFDSLNVRSSSDEKIAFSALYGGFGKAFPAEWGMVLTKTQTGYAGQLRLTSTTDPFTPIHLKFVPCKTGTMPSSELPGKIRLMDDAHYRSEDAILHEVNLAKQSWQQESEVAKRMAELRDDDQLRHGVRKEWVGPAWVRDRSNPDDLKYFERICCIYANGTGVTDADVRAMCALSELRELHLYSNRIGDAALLRIADLRGLRFLHLGSTEITDDGIEKLGTLTNLRQVYLNDTKVTKAGVARLQAKLPDAHIVD